MSGSILLGQSITFTSTVSGGYTPYSYQWYLDNAPVPGATSTLWAFTPTTSGIYYVCLKVTDANSNTMRSETARITVATVPVGGYSISIEGHTTAEPLTLYLAMIAISAIGFTTMKRKTIKRRK
jgi:PKD repeat protein